jgi:hypothetical protein
MWQGMGGEQRGRDLTHKKEPILPFRETNSINANNKKRRTR